MDASGEIKRLQGCVNDLIGVLALPAIWNGVGQSEVLGTLLDALCRVLSLDLAYARAVDAPDASPIEMVRLGSARIADAQAADVARAAHAWLEGAPAARFVAPHPTADGNLSIAHVRFGLQDDIGALVVGSRRPDFPTDIEMLLLRVAVNQASLALQEAAARREQRRAAERLEQTVAERTRQLTALNEELVKEIVERTRTENERRTLASLVENSADFIAIASLEGGIGFVNGAGRALVGLAGDEEVRVTTVLDYVAAPDRERVQREVIPTVLREGRWDGELRFTHFRSGATIPMLVHAFSIKEPGSRRAVALATISRDITARKQAEEALRRSEAYLAEGQRISQTGSWALNVATGELFWSQEHFHIYGLDPQTVKPSAEMMLEMVHPEDRPATREALADAVRERRHFARDYRIVCADGRIKHIHSLAHPVFDDSGLLTEYVGTVIDTTQRRLAEDTVQQAQSELARVARVVSMGELTASIAHEVNQPIAAIITNGNAGLRWLERETPDIGEARATVQRIIRDGNRAADVIKRIRAFLTRAEPARSEVRVEDVIGEVVTLVQGEARARHVLVQVRLADNLPSILADRIQLQQVLLNLALNAVEAMSGVRDRPRVLQLGAQPFGDDAILVEVSDSGDGLDARALDRIFDAFYTTKPQGMGMGLAISRSIVEAHDGRLWATPNGDHGTTFQFVLPRAATRAGSPI
jgi:PAS domain S-box-containing protein